MPTYTFYRELEVNTTMDEMWSFLSNPNNLQKLTPKGMGGEPVGEISDKVSEGMEVDYVIKPVPFIRLVWRARFPEVKDYEYFVDEQVKGPFVLWRHKHGIKPLDNKVLLTDEITYKPPLGILGALANKVFIRPQMEKLFEHRVHVLKEMYP